MKHSRSWSRPLRMQHLAKQDLILASAPRPFRVGANDLEALENLARYSQTTNEALAVEISRRKDEVILAVRHVQEFDEQHRQFFELLALWLIRMLHRKQTVISPRCA